MKNFLWQVFTIELLVLILCTFFGKNLYRQFFPQNRLAVSTVYGVNLNNSEVQSGLKKSINNLLDTRDGAMTVNKGRFNAIGILMKIMAREKGTYKTYDDGKIKTKLVGITPDAEEFIPLYMKEDGEVWKPATLSFFGNKNNMLIGTNILDRFTSSERELISQYSSITIEDEWNSSGTLQQSLDKVALLKEEGVQDIRIHALLYPQNLPDWLQKGKYTKEQLRMIMKTRIENMMSLYPTASSFVVVNEPFIPDNGREQHDIFYKAWGSYQYIAEAFRFARSYAHIHKRTASLFFNDGDNQYTTGTTRNSTRTIVTMLKENNLIDGVGMQMHVGDWGGGKEIDMDSMVAQFQNELKYYKNLKVPVYITEMTYMPTMNERLRGKKSIDTQVASVFTKVVRAAITSENVRGITTWGFTDKSLKTVNWYQLFDENAKPKEAYYDVLRLLYSSAVKNQK